MLTNRRLQTVGRCGWAGLLVLATAGCAPSVAPVPAGQPEAGAVAETPKYGGVFRWRISGDPPNLDPHLTTTHVNIANHNLVYNRLATLQFGPEVDPGTTKIVPDLAEGWEAVDDKTWVFHLRQGVRWQNVAPVNGRELVAEDVKFSYQRMGQKGSPTGANVADIAQIETPDRYTVRITTSQPVATLLGKLSDPFAKIVPQGVVAAKGDLKQVAIGTGPFLLESWERNTRLTFRKNPDYFVPGLPYLDRIETTIIPELSVALSAFLAGQIEISADELSPLDVEEARKADPKLQFERIQRAWWFGIWVRLDKEPFGDVRVRRAMSLAIDRDKLNKAIAYDQGAWIGPLPPNLGEWLLPQEELKQLYPHDPSRAKQLLAEAGYPNGFKTSALSTTQTGQKLIDMAQMVKEQFKAVGIDVEISFPEGGTYQKLRNDKDYVLNIGNFSAFTDPDDYFAAAYQSGEVRNYSLINDAKLDKMILDQRIAFDPAARKKLVLDVQRYLAQQMYIVHLVAPSNYWGWQPYVRNFRPHNVGASHSSAQLARVWLSN